MRHYKAAGFSDEVSRLAAASRRPSTNRMYDDRWRRFTRRAAGQGFDPLDPTSAQIASFLFDLFDTHGLSPQTIKGYRTCIGSVFMSTPFKGGRHIVLLRLASALALASSLTLRHPLLDFFWVHQNMIPAIQRSFSTGDLNLQDQGQACRGHHLKNHLN